MRAVLDTAREVGAVIDGAAQDVRVPAVDEVGVVSVTCGVAVGPDELAALALEGVGVPDGLVEKGGKTGLVTLRARATVNQVGVCHVRLVVIGCDILAVPARREEDLGANAVGAVSVEEVLVWHEVAVARALGGLVVVEAVEAQGLLHERLLGHVRGAPRGCWLVRDWASEVAHAGVTSEDLKTFGKGLNVVAEEEVVGEHSADLGNNLSLAIGVGEVQGRGPK